MSGELKAHFQHDTENDSITISHSQDVTAVLDANKIARANADSQKKSDMVRVASIPHVVVIEWMKEGINVMAPTYEDKKRMKMKLNSPDYAYLRTGGGRL